MMYRINPLLFLSLALLTIAVFGCGGDSPSTEATVESQIQGTLTAIRVIEETVQAYVRGTMTVMGESVTSSESDMQTPVSTNNPALMSTTPVSQEHESLFFSGYEWSVKFRAEPAGPGPNYFSKRKENVFVDDQGRLHMKIVYRNGQWFATEVINVESLGYGMYTFQLEAGADQIDPNVVLGLFTWDDSAPAENFREIDIEVSRWGDPANENAQYVVQPWERAGNIHRFDLALDNQTSTHSFCWYPDTISFKSSRGHHTADPPESDIIETWIYQGEDLPEPGEENVRINLWLMNGAAPINGQESEVIITDFSFTPWEGVNTRSVGP